MAFISFKSSPLRTLLFVNRISGQSVIKRDKLHNQFCCLKTVLFNAAEVHSFHHLACWRIPMNGYKYGVWYYYNFPYALYSFKSHLSKQNKNHYRHPQSPPLPKSVIVLYFQTCTSLLSRYLKVGFSSTEPVMPVLLLPLCLFSSSHNCAAPLFGSVPYK